MEDSDLAWFFGIAHQQDPYLMDMILDMKFKWTLRFCDTSKFELRCIYNYYRFD